MDAFVMNTTMSTMPCCALLGCDTTASRVAALRAVRLNTAFQDETDEHPAWEALLLDRARQNKAHEHDVD